MVVLGKIRAWRSLLPATVELPCEEVVSASNRRALFCVHVDCASLPSNITVGHVLVPSKCSGRRVLHLCRIPRNNFMICRIPIAVKAASPRRSVTVIVVLMIQSRNLFTSFCSNADPDTVHMKRHQERSCHLQGHHNTLPVALPAVTLITKHQVTRLPSLYPCGEPGKTRESAHAFFPCRL